MYKFTFTNIAHTLRASLLLLAGLLLFNAKQAKSQSVVCPSNIDFAQGNFTNWLCYTGTIASTGAITVNTLSGPVTNRHTITSGAGLDPYGGFPVVAPGGGTYSLRLGNDQTGYQAERVRYYIQVPAGFNNYSFTFKYAAVLQDGGHIPAQQPRFLVSAFDSATGNPIVCATLTYVAGVGLPGFVNTGSNSVIYMPWNTGSVNLSGQGGNTIVIEVTTTDCGQGGHFGYGYFDIVSCGQFQAAVADCDLSNNSVTFTGPAGYQSYVWKDSTLTTTLGTGPTLTVAAPALGSSTYYKVILTPYNSNGCPDTVKTPRITNFKINASPDSVCNTLGAPVQLNTTLSYQDPNMPYTYRWTPGATLSDTTIANPIAYPQTSGNYIVKVTDTVGCYRRDTVKVQNPHFTVNFLPDSINTCLGTAVTLNPVITPASSAYVYTWTPGANLSSTTIKNPVYTPAAVGVAKYVLRVDSGICAARDTVTIRTLPNSFNVTDTAVCEGVTFQPSISGDPNFTYTWSPAINLSNPNVIRPFVTSDTTRTYTITAHYPTCPNMPKPFNLRVEPNPVVNLGPDLSKCKTTPLYISAAVAPTWFTPYSYTWNPDPNINNPSIPNIIFTGTTDTTLTLTVKTPLGCTGKDDIHIHVYSANFASISPLDTNICPRDTIFFKAAGGVKYDWEPKTYLSNGSIANPFSAPVTSVGYTLYVTDANNCHDTLYPAITVNPEATLSLGDSVVIYDGETWQMDPKGNCLYFTWFPQNGLSNPNIANPIASPSVNTRYYVVATTEAGCKATDTVDVVVRDETAIDVPNAFTPGSYPNALLKVVRRGPATLNYFRVYDRWGTKVFETTNIDEGWNGQFNGQPQPMGVYIYMVDATTKTGRHFYKQGNVTLLR